MAQDIDKAPNKQSQTIARELLSKHNVEDPNEANPKRELFLALLKSRYGYTNEKAVDELERLLKQFYKMNTSLGINRTRPIFRRKHVE